MATESTPYSTLSDLLGAGGPAWIADPVEQARIASYDLYEDIYWAEPESFKLVQRGEDESPIYIPSGRTIVETLHRYLANDMTVIPDPRFGTPAEQELALGFWINFTRRERYYSKFNTNKRMGIIRGDWVFHIKGDAERAPLARVSIETIHPGSLFPIKQTDVDEDGDPNVLIGWHIAEIVSEGNDSVVKRTTYLKETLTGGPSPISLEIGIYELNAWGGPGETKDPKKLRSVFGPETFPAPIDTLPIYHIPNFQNDRWDWGSSEMRGLERVLSAVNQSISDEELELVLNGLGCYATNAAKPIDPETGETIEWDLGPARVVQVPGGPGSFFQRVNGTTTVGPHQDHLKYLHDRLDEASGTPAVAKGRVDVTTAESGIALQLQMGPLLARVSEKEQIITDVVTNWLFDLSKWIVAYEGGEFNFMLESTRLIPVYGDKIPVNHKQKFDEIIAMATATPIPVIPLMVAWDELRKIGYEDLPENDVLLAQIAQQTQMMADAQMASIEGRIGEELGTDEETEELSTGQESETEPQLEEQ